MSITMGQLASKFMAAANKVDPVMERRFRTVEQVGTGLVKSEIQAVHAVDTGTMLNSTTAERVGKRQSLIGPTVRYAVYVALGTSRVIARPFHIRAAKKLQSQIDKIMDLSPEELGL